MASKHQDPAFEQNFEDALHDAYGWGGSAFDEVKEVATLPAPQFAELGRRRKELDRLEDRERQLTRDRVGKLARLSGGSAFENAVDAFRHGKLPKKSAKELREEAEISERFRSALERAGIHKPLKFGTLRKKSSWEKTSSTVYVAGGIASYLVLANASYKNVRADQNRMAINPLETAGALTGFGVAVLNMKSVVGVLALGLGAVAYESYLSRKFLPALPSSIAAGWEPWERREGWERREDWRRAREHEHEYRW